MAGFFILITFVLTSIRSSTIWCLVFGSLSMYAIRLTTSKTTMVVLGIYLLCLLIVRALPERMRFPAVRYLALWSFAAIFIPFILMLFLSGTNLTTTSSFLFSMQDRINNSWQLPFSYLWQLMPIGLVTGCGLGCFNYPMQLFSPWASLWVPVDNFYIGTYLMFGLPFVGFMWMVFRAAFLITDIYKLCTIFTMNLFTITVLSYGPATGLLMIALAFSEVFSFKRRDRCTEMPRRAPACPLSRPTRRLAPLNREGTDSMRTRLAFIDSLRGIAVVAVLIQHLLEQIILPRRRVRITGAFRGRRDITSTSAASAWCCFSSSADL